MNTKISSGCKTSAALPCWAMSFIICQHFKNPYGPPLACLRSSQRYHNGQNFFFWVTVKMFPPMVSVPDLPLGLSYSGMESTTDPLLSAKGVAV